MNLSSAAQVTENFYLREAQKLLQKIGEATIDAADAINKFDITTNDDKVCIATVGNNFARDLEYTLNKIQRITIDNHKQGDDNKNLKEAVLAFSTFVFSIQQAFGDDFNKLKLEVYNALQNLGAKLDPLLDIVREHSSYSSKWELTSTLDYLYIAIEKVKLRIQWEHLDQAELEKTFADVLEAVLSVLDKLSDRQDQLSYFRRACHATVEGIYQVLEETDLDMEHYDDKIRNIFLIVNNKVADELFDFDKAVRTKKNMSELTLYAKLYTINTVPVINEVLGILKNKSLLDSDPNIRNFTMNVILNGLSCSIRLTKDFQRILED